jgi:hypothetical protein|tara:strand:+ start:702 stop:911 length:210 start_codon:yes stop_codon:yes gene_type:complete
VASFGHIHHSPRKEALVYAVKASLIVQIMDNSGIEGDDDQAFIKRHGFNTMSLKDLEQACNAAEHGVYT